jgi:hypothetical protein
MAWNVLKEMQDHNSPTTIGEMIMKKLFAIAAMAVTLCLTGLVMSGEAQVQRFVDNGNGTVTDTMTGLMWTKDANMFGELFWEQAMEKCGSLSISGVGGWRLPSKDELLFLYYSINQNEHPFTRVQSDYYWGSGMSHVSMRHGRVEISHAGFYHVWPVRAGQ